MASQEAQGSSSDTYQPPLWEYVTKLEKQGSSGGAWKFKCNICSETRQGSYSRVRAHLLGIKDTYQPPLWEYVTKLEKQGSSGGAWKFKCNLCSETRQGSYSRVRAHLLGIKGTGIAICKSATAGDKQKMKQLEEAYEEKKAESNAKEVADQLDQEIARMFYTGGLPSNLARNPHYLRAFQFAAANKIDGYVPPSYNKLRTTLLQKEKDNVHMQLEPLRSTWKEKGVTIVSDGWSDPTRKPLINFMATSSKGPLFLKAVNCFGEVKDRFFIAVLMKEVINDIGHQNVVQIITDNAANCKAAGQLIESQFPYIYWTHVLFIRLILL
nr:hAT dimerization domain, ribonuclease H-like domain protein [Tanacetum cinerariifolium]